MRAFGRWPAALPALALAFVFAALPAHPQTSPPAVVDDFEDVSEWRPFPADGVELRLSGDAGRNGRALRMDFGFTGGGYAVAKKTFGLTLPENYAFTFQIKGQALPNTLEFKLLDESGENVWWSVRRDMTFQDVWQPITIKKRHIQFAWGPKGGGEIRRVAAIEIVVTAGGGGRGTVWVDDLELRALPPPGTTPRAPVVKASSWIPRGDPSKATDGDSATAWTADSKDSAPWIVVDFQEPREFGGLSILWAPGRHALSYLIESGGDGPGWRALRTVRESGGGRDDVFLPESETGRLRVRAVQAASPDGVSLKEIVVRPLEFGASRESFFQSIAQEARRGLYPRGFSGEQSYWTVVGVDDDPREVLFSEDGMIETGKRRFSIEPFLTVDGRLFTWADVEARHVLDQGFLPIPTVTWPAEGLDLDITAFGTGPAGRSAVAVRYRLTNHRPAPFQASLHLALRPFQVNPPSQFLNDAGGCAPVREMARSGSGLLVNGETAFVCLTPPTSFGARVFDEGDIVAEHLVRGGLGGREAVQDSFEAASGLLSWTLDLDPGQATDVGLVIPLYPESEMPVAERSTPAWIEERLKEARAGWLKKTERIHIELPPSGATFLQSLKAQLGWILINRAGPAIQPGARAYARSWIRDGALTSTALLSLDHAEEVRAFIDWYAPHQFSNGKIPCVVDRRGADPVPEHDSSGEFIYLVAEFFRFTGDREFALAHWPRVLKAAAYLDSLRRERLTKEYEGADRREFHGILPPSISHEGYSAKPMHSYWDDFWALRGFEDAAWLARTLEFTPECERLSRLRDDFRRDLGSSIESAMSRHGIDYVPGCADLGDFDATSTTIALNPARARSTPPPGAIERTFEKYWEFFEARRKGAPWDAYTPYEIRNIGAFVRLGWRSRAHDALAYFLSHQRPLGWRQWPEVIRADVRKSGFLGDLPHTWVGSDFVRAALDLFAWHDEEKDALVIGSGVPIAWIEAEPGVVVGNLPTRFGGLSYTMKRTTSGLEIEIQKGLRIPGGGLIVRAPWPESPARVVVNGKSVWPAPRGDLIVRELPARILLSP
jgi:hypothetical protein